MSFLKNRSSYTELDLADNTVNMGIRFPSYNRAEPEDYVQYKTKYKRLYNSSYISWYLNKCGIADAHPIVEKSIKNCVFLDPSGLSCRISVDDGMLFEREEIFEEYLKLDERIRPLILVILHFATCNKITKSK